MKDIFKDKKILFFSASFFGYQTEICKSLSRLGAGVDFFDERPKNTFWTKAMIRIDKRIIKNKIEKYYQKIIENTSETEYDYVFFLKAEVITLKMLQHLKRRQPKAKFVLYMWDSIKNSGSVEELFPIFDKILSFDRMDVEKNSFLIFRPLFYLDEYKKIALKEVKEIYDITFIGTGHTDRYDLISKVKEFCNDNKLNGYFFMYLQDLKIFFARKIFQKKFRNAKQKDFSFAPLRKEEIIKIIQESKCVLDIERAVQCGLTMRTIEVLGARKKLITTNSDIMNYDLYNENNIYVIDRLNPQLSIDFINGKYQHIDEDIYEKYCINSWLHEVFQ